MLCAGGYAYGLAVHPEKEELYISMYIGQKIVMTSLDGNGETTLINSTGKPQGVAVDIHKR